MDGGFVLMAGTETGVSLSVARWPNRRISPLLILLKSVDDGTVLDFCILMYG